MTSGRGYSPFGGSGSAAEAIICFARGTMILTPRGERRVECLKPGDTVVTLDNGPQAIRWVGATSVSASGVSAPVRFCRGAIGNDRDLFVSPHHRMLLKGGGEVLVPACALIDDFRVTVAYGGMVAYHHIMFERHQVVIANGAPSESFHPSGSSLDALDPRARDELFAEFPALRSDVSAYGRISRPCASADAVHVLLAG